MPGPRGTSRCAPSFARDVPLVALLATATIGLPPRAAHALMSGEIPSHSALARQVCIAPKDFGIIKLGGYYHVYSIRVDRTIPDVTGGANTNTFMHQRSFGNLQNWEIYPDEPLENPPRTGFDDDHIWAPSLVDRNGLIHMFYTGVADVGSVPVQKMGVRTATNLNLISSPWNPVGTDPTGPVFECVPVTMPWDCANGDFRDPFVMRNPNANNWLMYYVGRRSNGQMGIGVGVSGSDASGDPLVGTWTHAGELVDNVAKYGGTKVESPHFFQHGDTRYMLFTGSCVGTPCDGGNMIHILTTTDPTLAPSSWVNRGTLDAMLGANLSLWFASEYVKDPDTGEEFLGLFRQSEVNLSCQSPPETAESDSGNVEFRRIIWDVDPLNPWKFKLADPNPPGFWLQQASSGPSARTHHGMAVDTKRHRVMAFGGIDAGGAKNDYWVYKLSLTPDWGNWSTGGTAPTARNRPGVVYDPLGDRMIVIGGYSGVGVGTLLTDVHQLTGLQTFPTWSAINASGGPSQVVYGLETVFDPVRNRAISVDGSGRAWALDLPSGQAPTWTTLQNGGGLITAGGFFFNLVYDSKRDRLIAFGGWLAVQGSNNSLNGVQVFPLSGPNANTWQTITVSGTPPSKRSLSSAFYDPVRDRLVVHGGQMPGDGSGAVYGDDWQLQFGTVANTGTWTQLSSPTTMPSARGGHVAVYDPTEDRAVEFGGRTGPSTYSSQTWSRSLGQAGAPWQVTDLTWTTHCTSIDFSWTAPRDDKPNASDDASVPIAGNATTYELRRSTQSITEGNWWSSELVSSGPSAAAGTTQTVVVGEPTCLLLRFYAVKTRDEQGRWSWASNSTWNTKCHGSGGPPYCWDESVTAAIAPDRMSLDVRGSNPADGPVRLSYGIPNGASGSFDVTVYDVAGRLVSELARGDAAPGTRELTWSPTTTGRGGGVYFVRFRLGDQRIGRSVVVR